jgi:hypothetical protein
MRVRLLTRAQLNALESPAGSKKYPSLLPYPIVSIIDEDVEEGIFAESYGPGAGVEVNTNATWLDGKPIYKISYTAGSTTPGTAGVNLTTTLPVIATLVRTEGYGTLTNNKSGGWVELGGSGFAMTARDDRKLVLTGPPSVTLYSVHVTLWYTK